MKKWNCRLYHVHRCFVYIVFHSFCHVDSTLFSVFDCMLRISDTTQYRHELLAIQTYNLYLLNHVGSLIIFDKFIPELIQTYDKLHLILCMPLLVSIYSTLLYLIQFSL